MPGLDFSSLDKAIASLDRGLARWQAAPADAELRDACVQRFEYTFDLCWKMLKRQLEREVPSPSEVDSWSFRHLFRVAGERGLVDDVEAWFDWRDKRNITSHLYDEKKAREIAAAIPDFARAARVLRDRMAARGDT
jgi:nucleotidyltransferase substrate binding protein (TIGR01987 family)